ncbi:hypothetical protein Tco_1546833 [Tanacetum coccineum]
MEENDKRYSFILDGGAKLSSKTPELESLLLHYTNHAVIQMSIEKTRKDLDDCRMATYLDHGFLKVCLIAGKIWFVGNWIRHFALIKSASTQEWFAWT